MVSLLQSWKRYEVSLVHLHSFEPNKQCLVGDQVTTVALPEFDETVRATSEDQHGRNANEGQENLESGVESYRLAGTEVTKQIVTKQTDEDDEGKHLERHAGEGEIDADLARPRA